MVEKLYDVVDEDGDIIYSGLTYNEAQSETEEDGRYIVEHEE